MRSIFTKLFVLLFLFSQQVTAQQITRPFNGGTGVSNSNSSTLTISGAFPLTLTLGGSTGVTLPSTGTLATLAGSESLTNKTIPSVVITGSPTAAGATWTDLGSVTTVDINGGTVDGTTIGGATPAAGTFTTLTSTGNATLGDSTSLDSHSVSGAVTFSANTAGTGFKITQAGAGDVLVIEDIASDPTPFVIDAVGRNIRGHTTALSTFTNGTDTPIVQQIAVAASAAQTAIAGFGQPTSTLMARSGGATVGDYTAITTGTVVTTFEAQASDGTDFARVANFSFGVEGTVGANQTPGNMVMRTANSSGTITDAARIDSSQILSLGSAAAQGAISTFNGSTEAPRLQVVGTTNANLSRLALARFDGTAADAPALIGAKSNNNTYANYAAVASGDTLFIQAAEGSDGTDFARSSTITFQVDGTVGADQVPGRIVFSTANAAGTVTEAARFDSAQHLLFKGPAAPSMGACGTSPSVAGRDQAMLVTVGTGGVATSCAVTFGVAWTTAPVCTAMNDTDRVAYNMVTTTTTVTVAAAAAFTASSKFHIICMGY